MTIFTRIRGAIAAIALVLAATAADANHHMGGHADSKPSIVEIAVGNEDFTTLVTALKAAGLVDALAGEGPFTVLAPTDAAFDALPAGALEGLLANPTQLAEVLKLHVIAGKAMATDVAGLQAVDTLAGSTLVVDTMNGVAIGGAKVVATDIEASNGVIHVIDRVILPQR